MLVTVLLLSLMQAAPAAKQPDPKTLELQRAHLENQRRLIAQFDDVLSKSDRNYYATADVNKDLHIVYWLCIVSISVLILQMLYKWSIDRKQEVRFQAMIAHSTTLLEIAAAHGKVTDNQKDRTIMAGQKVERAGQAVAVASVRAAKVAKVAAERADLATKKAEEAVLTMEERMEAIGKEVHAMKEQMNQLIARLCPDGLGTPP